MNIKIDIRVPRKSRPCLEISLSLYYCDDNFEATVTFRRRVTGLINHHQNKKPKDEND